MAPQPNLGLICLIVEVSRSYTIKNTHTVELLWMSDQPVAEGATDATHNQHKRTDIRALSGIGTRDIKNRAAADLPLRPHGHRNWP
jgi:hypothetical protein